MEEKYTEKLARYIIFLITAGIICAVCWYFRKIILYILAAVVVAFLAFPFYKFIRKAHIGKHRCPDWLGAITALMCVFGLVAGAINLILPLLNAVANDISAANVSNMAMAVSVPLADFNAWAPSVFANLGDDFHIEYVVLEQVQKMFDVSSFSNVLGSVTSFLAGLAVAGFSIIFIAFFVIKTPHLLSKVLIAIFPEKYEKKIHSSLNQIGRLVTRYLVGLTIEVVGVSLVNFLGLWLVARMGFRYSLGIAFLTGILNIVPYIGPLIGGAIGVSLSLVIRYACATPFGLAIGFGPFVLVLIGIFLFTQLIDNYIYQPVIYSNSVRVHPLEIFLVFLIAGQVGGMIGMLAAVPAYTVLRVIAKEFWGDVRIVKMITSSGD